MQVKRNIMVNRAGGTASKNGKTYRVSLPAEMIRELGVTDEDRGVILTSENGEIRIKKE